MRKILGKIYQEEIDWNNEVIQHKDQILHEASLPIPIDQVHLLIKEMTEQEKRSMIACLSLPIDLTGKKRAFPDPLFQKEMNIILNRCKRDNKHEKIKLIFAIREIVSSLVEEEEELHVFIGKQEELIASFGFWHYYWAFYLHPDKENNQVLWQKKHDQLVADLDNGPKEAPEEMPEQEITEYIQKEDIQKKVLQLEKKIEMEQKRRHEREEEANQQKQELIQKEKQIQQLIERNHHLENEISKWCNRNEELIEQGEVEKRNWTKRNQDLIQDNKILQNQMRELDLQLVKKTKELDQMTKLSESRKNEIIQFKKELKEDQRKQTESQNLSSLIQEMILRVYQKINTINELLLAGTPTGSFTAKELREQIKQALIFIDDLEEFSSQKILANEIQEIGLSTKMVENNMEELEEEITEDQPSEDGQNVYPGIFYRRDHGGFIQLENGETFNITESLVHENDLQHEAEVECTPLEEKNGVMQYDIKLLFQGDDHYAPIHQYDGYIELGEYHALYCVDMNNSENRFILHEKDRMFLKPENGTPCTFNVAYGKDIARISRIYKVFDEEKRAASQQNAQGNQKKEKVERPKEKPQPFLQGSRIAVIGGQKKWFEEVVLETGAELIHDDGRSPERIYTELKKSHALFFLLTSVSHRATWGSIEIAKENHIPHFIIQGSKSNFRHLLWSNRETIADKTT